MSIIDYLMSYSLSIVMAISFIAMIVRTLIEDHREEERIEKQYRFFFPNDREKK